uniref:Insc_C domain-containing protein n=1 Tax=Haemonchus contortus TaxID=6289 RepID=A0A7I5E840_HAECO
VCDGNQAMPTGIARYWDSLEGNDYLDQCQPHTGHFPRLDDCQKQWLSELSSTTEPECQSILYAKSLLDDGTDSATPVIQELQQLPEPQPKISVGFRCNSLSSSTGNLTGPSKPQKRIIRLKNSKQETIGSTSVPHICSAQSTLDLIESYKFSESHVNIGEMKSVAPGHSHTNVYLNGDAVSSSANQKSSTTTTKTLPADYSSWAPPGFRCAAGCSTTELNAQNVPNRSSHLFKSPPTYDQLRIKFEKNGSSRSVVNKKMALRHMIAVNHEDSVDQSREQGGTSASQRSTSDIPRVPPHAPSSPKSMRSDSTLSVDSGQCSGDVALTSQHSFSSSREEREEKDQLDETSSIFHVYQQRCLPGYARIASTMDHVLRTASSIFAQLGGPTNPSTAKELLDRTTAFIQIIESSPCAHHLPKYDTNVVRLQINDLQREAAETGLPLTITNYFTIVVRKMIEQVLQVFCKIIARYLTECGNKDRLVLIALEHLIHLVLFGDDLCLEAIQSGALHSVLKLVRQASTPPETNKLLLRALAVLCAVSKGCLSLLALGGLEVVLSHLTGNHVGSSIEAAGVLTQLTNPQHSYVQLQNIGPILVRLLDLIDECTTGETLLLVSAALANVSLQDPAAIDLLYRHNAIIRLINAYNRQECSTIFVQEQIVTVLSRLAARRYEEALVSQGAVPVLLEMLTVTDNLHSDYCRRIRYKAAVCIGTLAATGVGLKALYVNQAFAILTHVLEMESSPANPLNMICTNIRNRLESKYQIESAV